MKLLLDTHTFLWYITGEKLIPNDTLQKINNISNYCCISIASIWEIVIKMSLNKLEINGGFKTIEDFLATNEFEILPIDFKHTKSLLNLPLHHNDPFDRMIIAQSISENLTIITKDNKFTYYEIDVLW